MSSFTETIRDAFPSAASQLLPSVLEVIPPGSSASPLFSSDDIGNVSLHGERLRIPARTYLLAPFESSSLSAECGAMLACLYSRHHSGYVRETHMHVVARAQVDWAIPYLLAALGDYVIQVSSIAAGALREASPARYAPFLAENPDFASRLKQRIASYWACYYRYEYRQLRDYPPVKNSLGIGLWTPREQKRLNRQTRST